MGKGGTAAKLESTADRLGEWWWGLNSASAAASKLGWGMRAVVLVPAVCCLGIGLDFRGKDGTSAGLTPAPGRRDQW